MADTAHPAPTASGHLSPGDAELLDWMLGLPDTSKPLPQVDYTDEITPPGPAGPIPFTMTNGCTGYLTGGTAALASWLYGMEPETDR